MKFAKKKKSKSKIKFNEGCFFGQHPLGEKSSPATAREFEPYIR